MKKKITSLITLSVTLILVITLVVPSVVFAADTSQIGAVVDSFESNDQTFTLSASGRFFVVSDTEPTGELLQTVQLAQRQFAADGKPSSAVLPIVWGEKDWAKTGDIVVCLDTASGLTAETYKLEVGGTATVTAGDVDGLLHGLNMLLKHFRAGGNTIQGFTLQDAPDTTERTVSLDCGRKYYTKDWICNFIREMSWMGYNTLQFHFSDDSGFRFDLWDEAYYKGDFQPKNDFSWICGSNYTSWTLPDYQNDQDKGKYLTTAEVVEILETAKEYHIEVIPCFDSPSHLDYLTWTYEQNYKSNNSYSFYSTYDSKTYYAKDVKGIINYTNSSGWSTPLQWPYYSSVNVKGAQAKAFVFELYIDIANFFKEYAGSTDISVGADEVQLSTSNLASGYSYAWGFMDFVSYINELNTLLNSKGYTMRMYNDFMGSTSYKASDYKFADNIEIQYWDSPFNPSSSTASNHTEPVSYYVNEGRILYNCIQTNTYYALRKTSSGSDARSVKNRQWTFYHSNEEDIWNEWYPADISEHGDYSEDVADVPAGNLGGAYFLIWCDYACISTEKEIWNGCYDTSGSGEYYSLRDRMWSNITKQWNWDVNDTLEFEGFVTIRDAYGDFPGCGTTTSACSEETVLPTATTPTQAYRADHAELTAALENVLTDGSGYTSASWEAYQNAVEAAQTVNDSHGATAEELAAQVAALTAAKDNLVTRSCTLTVEIKATIDGTVRTLGTITCGLEEGDNSYELYLQPIKGYRFLMAEGTTFVPLDSGDGSGYIRGSVYRDTTVRVWYENLPDTDRLKDVLAEQVVQQGNYTNESWKAYITALDAAEKFTVSAATTQDDVDKVVNDLLAARAALVTVADATQFIRIEKLTPTTQRGKLVGLRITTTPDVQTLSIEGEALTICTGRVQTLNDGTTVKIWLIGFYADEIGTVNYSVCAAASGKTLTLSVSITVN